MHPRLGLQNEEGWPDRVGRRVSRPGHHPVGLAGVNQHGPVEVSVAQGSFRFFHGLEVLAPGHPFVELFHHLAKVRAVLVVHDFDPSHVQAGFFRQSQDLVLLPQDDRFNQVILL